MTRFVLETFYTLFLDGGLSRARSSLGHSAAAQGAQASEPRGADRPILTGLSPSVPTPEDAVRQAYMTPHSCVPVVSFFVLL